MTKPFLFILILLLSCGAEELFFVDESITLEDAEEQDYKFITPRFGIQVAIRDDVGLSSNEIMEIIDRRSANFLECQFEGDADIIGNEEPPLSQLRVFVVPFRFMCDAVGITECSGIYYFGADLTIVSEGLCDNLGVYGHELGHRYGMTADHSNQSEFEKCIRSPDCDFDFDFID